MDGSNNANIHSQEQQQQQRDDSSARNPARNPATSDAAKDANDLKSPLTSVKQLLADTGAAPPSHNPVNGQAPGLAGGPQAQPESSDAGTSQQQQQQQRGVSFADAVKQGTSAETSSSKKADKASTSSTGSQQHERPTFQQTLSDLRNFLMPFLKILPFQSLHGFIKRFIGPLVRFVVRVVATVLHRWNFGLASNLAYDLHILLWKWVINLFFREIRPRGAYKVPRDGPVLFVCGPHHNQFLDPLLLMSEVRLSANRRVSFLIAAKSYERTFIGLASKIAHSIPVARAADGAVNGKGRIYITSKDATEIKGIKTSFKTQLTPKAQIQLSKAYGFPTVEVVEVIDDETVKIKKMFSKEKVVQDLFEEGQNVEKGNTEGGLAYKCLPYIDQTKMYSSVYKKLSEGGCIGIFPEGGSHDRTDFLPLKHGLAIMALGAMAANPNLKVRIVPVGLNYFHPHRFRSRAVIEFGAPISIGPELVETFAQGGQGKRDAIGSIMDLVFDGLKSVTVRGPDYDTLMVIQASRRLYKPPGQQLNLSQVVELNKRFIIGYNTYKDEPRVQQLYKQVQAYNKRLRQLGLKDHQVEGANKPKWKSLLLLLWRTGLISAWTVMALPGIVMNGPIFIAASIISRKKAKEALAASTVKLQGRDVLATWKVLVSLGMAPVLYAFYTLIAMYCVFRYDLGRKYLFLTPLFMMVAVPSFGYSALRFGEVGMDIYKSLPPLFMSLFPSQHKLIEQLRTQRREVTEELTATIEEFAPKLWADFESRRIIPNSEFSHSYSAEGDGYGTPTGTTPRRKSTFGPESSILSHPMTWIDEKVFGWSAKTPRRMWGSDEYGSGEQTPSASQPVTPGYRTESEDDPADYDEVVRGVEERLNGSANGDEQGENKRLRRRASRTKSQMNLSQIYGSEDTASTTGIQQNTTKADQRAPHDSYADAVKEGDN